MTRKSIGPKFRLHTYPEISSPARDEISRLIFRHSLFLSDRLRPRGAGIVGGMGEVKGVLADLGSSLFLEPGSQGLDIVVDNRRLNENEQFIALFVVGCRFEQIPEVGNIHQIRDTAIILCYLVLDQTA